MQLRQRAYLLDILRSDDTLQDFRTAIADGSAFRPVGPLMQAES